MTVKDYCILGAAGDATLRFKIKLDGYKMRKASDDTVQTSITGKLLRHTGSLFSEWEGIFRVKSSPEADHGTIAQLKAIHGLQAALDFTAPEEDTATEVLWLGPFEQIPMRGPLDIVHIPFLLKATSGT